jgi:F-type H+-transporting ATPase subunit epsilon
MPIQLEIVTPQGVTFSASVLSVTVPGVDGDFEVHVGHAPVMSGLRTGVVQIEDTEGYASYAAVIGGFVEVAADHVSVLATLAEMGDDIDAERAQQAKARAEKRIKQAESGTDLPRAQESLERADNRLNVVKRLKAQE